MRENSSSLEDLREKIDQIDIELLHLLNNRAKVVIQIQHIKICLGLPAYSAIREGEILQRLRTANQGPLPDDAIEDIFRRILQHSLASLRTDDES